MYLAVLISFGLRVANQDYLVKVDDRVSICLIQRDNGDRWITNHTWFTHLCSLDSVVVYLVCVFTCYLMGYRANPKSAS